MTNQRKKNAIAMTIQVILYGPKLTTINNKKKLIKRQFLTRKELDLLMVG